MAVLFSSCMEPLSLPWFLTKGKHSSAASKFRSFRAENDGNDDDDDDDKGVDVAPAA